MPRNKLDARYREHQSVVKPTKEDVLAGRHLLLLTRAGPLDLLGFIGDKSRYEDMLPRSTEISMGAGTLRVLDLEELISQKRVSDRPKDRAMLELLEEALRLRNKRE